ncbi:MAG: hypothetical protein IKC58_05110, partial [Clostridia bacterium]|nr:hypothetical protein [Clostridia bacterium]
FGVLSNQININHCSLPRLLFSIHHFSTSKLILQSFSDILLTKDTLSARLAKIVAFWRKIAYNILDVWYQHPRILIYAVHQVE